MMSKIEWNQWGEGAFARAAAESKPILLSISAVWCHWCHVMDHTSYADPDVIEKINRQFVPVRIDNDERPDINARYNMGGWPTTAFLTPDGSIITGATYLPPAQMRRALDEISGYYREHTAEVDARAQELREAKVQYSIPPADVLAPVLLDEYTELVISNYDEEYGGFGDEMKFPQPELLDFLLTRWRTTNEPRLYDIVAQTMRAMSGGGMYDRIEGGYFRYSTTRDWSVPHFEKMAEDHGGLLRVLAQLQLCAPAEQWRGDLERTLTYVRTALLDPQTQFFAGSQDADETYYSLDAAGRAAHGAPFIDRRSYSNWTASLAGAFACCGAALDDAPLIAQAERTLDALHERARAEDGLLYHVLAPGEPPRVAGLLGDQVAYVRALLDAYETGGRAELLARAAGHAALTVERFAAPDGGFYDRAGGERLGRLERPDRPLPENGIMAENLLRLAALTHEPGQRHEAERVLRFFAPSFGRAHSFAATYARALARYLAPEVTVRLEGDSDGGLRRAARRLPTPFAVVATDGAPGPRAYLCVGTACAAPVAEPAELAEAYAQIA